MHFDSLMVGKAMPMNSIDSYKHLVVVSYTGSIVIGSGVTSMHYEDLTNTGSNGND